MVVFWWDQNSPKLNNKYEKNTGMTWKGAENKNFSGTSTRECLELSVAKANKGKILPRPSYLI